MSRRTAATFATVVVLAGLVAGAPVTLARFRDAESTTGTLSTATLQPPTSLAGTSGTSASLTWTPSTSGLAAGYTVLRSMTSGTGYGQVGTVTPVTATTTNDSPGAGTWCYALRTSFYNWTSVRSNVASVTVGLPTTTTGWADCTTTAAETVNAGDNNGYEGNPGRACALDGSVATDTDSGTSSTNSCMANARDKHRFSGHATGPPGAVAAITGITVRATAGMNNNGGETWLCAQLSADAGATWTTPKSVELGSTALTAYSLGDAADRWGRPSWTLAELAPAQLRVRVIDSSSQPNKQVRLDAIQVALTYTP